MRVAREALHQSGGEIGAQLRGPYGRSASGAERWRQRASDPVQRFPSWSRPKSSGVTLLELMVVLAVLGLLIGIGGPALGALRPPRTSERESRLREARATAIRSGRPVPVVDTSAGLPAAVLFLPDGRAAGPGVDPLTGAPHDAAR